MIVGAAIAILPAWLVVRSLNLKLEKLGTGLGVEGFFEGGIHIVGDTSVAGDMAGRDIWKS